MSRGLTNFLSSRRNSIKRTAHPRRSSLELQAAYAAATTSGASETVSLCKLPAEVWRFVVERCAAAAREVSLRAAAKAASAELLTKWRLFTCSSCAPAPRRAGAFCRHSLLNASKHCVYRRANGRSPLLRCFKALTPYTHKSNKAAELLDGQDLFVFCCLAGASSGGRPISAR